MTTTTDASSLELLYDHLEPALAHLAEAIPELTKVFAGRNLLHLDASELFLFNQLESLRELDRGITNLQAILERHLDRFERDDDDDAEGA